MLDRGSMRKHGAVLEDQAHREKQPFFEMPRVPKGETIELGLQVMCAEHVFRRSRAVLTRGSIAWLVPHRQRKPDPACSAVKVIRLAMQMPMWEAINGKFLKVSALRVAQNVSASAKVLHFVNNSC